MFILFGISSVTKVLGISQAVCPRCGSAAQQRVIARRRRLSLFFIPLVPLGSSYVVECAACGSHRGVDKGEANRVLRAG